MRRLIIMIVFTTFVLTVPAMALSWEDEPRADTGAVVIEESEEGAMAPEALRDERILTLEDKYSALLQDLSVQISDESDAFERERLQKEGEALKHERELALKGLQMDIAVERGDEDRAEEIEEALDHLYDP